MNKTFRNVLLSLAAIAIVAIVIWQYSFIFSKRVIGPIIEIDRVAPADMILNSRTPDPLLVHTFALAIKDQSGDIFTSSSVDERWAVARKGMCVAARFYPYPPWDFKRFSTYENAQLLELRDCKTLNLPDIVPSSAVPVASPSPPATASPGVPTNP